MPLTVDQFAKALEEAGVLPAHDIHALCQQKSFQDASAFARYLVRQNRLTPFQANVLMKGSGQPLVLGNYVLLEQLGGGGMGEVYKARHRSMNREVAVKVIRPERLQKKLALQRFQREIKIASLLNHPNIVRAFDALEDNGRMLLVLEYIEGTNLARLVREHGPLPVAQAVDYVRQAALGLQHAHEQGLVHRDIKPSNLLLDKTGTVKILDLGLARSTEESDDFATLTKEGTVLGTIDYISPEQAANSHTADIRADIYSLGATFYYLLTGQVPFPGQNLAEKLVKLRQQEPEPVTHYRNDVPPYVVAVLQKMMAKKPEQRYQTPAEVVAALTTPPTSAVPGQPIPSPPHQAPLVPVTQPSNRHLWWLAGAALFMLMSFFFSCGVVLSLLVRK